MSVLHILIACVVAFVVSIFGVSVGGTSLITVPALISLGMSPKDAIATNMFALIFLSVSGAVRFRTQMEARHYTMLFFLSLLTVCGSLIGAHLVLSIEKQTLEKIIAIMICAIALSLLFKRDLGVQETGKPASTTRFAVGSLLIFVLGIYGGFFSGGYVTFLSYVLILVFHLNFLQVAFITKVFNVFSSLTASAFFLYHGLINFHVGIPMAVSASLGASLGATLALAKGNVWVRNLFVIAAIILAIKFLLF